MTAWRVLWAVGAVAIGLAACDSAGADDSTFKTPTGSAGSAGSNGPGAGGGDAGGAGGAAGGGVNLMGGMTGGNDPVCQAKEQPGQRVPANLLIILDRSGSMQDGGKWSAAVGALNTMVDTAAPDLKVGLLRYPENTPNPNMCNPFDICTFLPCQLDHECTDIAKQPNVPVGPLSQTRDQIKNIVSITDPNGGTPTRWALKRGWEYMKNLGGEGDKFVLLVTDGEPTTASAPIGCSPAAGLECGQLSDIAKETTDARTGTPSVRSFVIGAPGTESSQEVLSGIAQNGGTCRPGGSPANLTCHYQIGSANFEKDLADTLKAITGSVSNCTYNVPTPENEMVDPDKVNVIITTSDGEQTIGKDSTHQNGWDYTDDSKSKIQIYGAPCDAINQGPSASVKIALGCQTKLN